MSPSDSRLRRLATAATVATGLALLGASAGGVMALESDLRAATHSVVPTRLAEEAAPGAQWRCRRAHPPARYSPEI